jgi:hypothetical protein
MAKRLSSVACLLAALSAVPFLCLAQQKSTVMPLVPAADWRRMDSTSLAVSAVSNYGGDPAIEREYGVKTVELRTYQVDQIPVKVLVEPAADSTSAYGLLTFYRTAAMTPAKGVALSFTDASGTLMARGKNFIRFLRPKDSPLSENDYQALLMFVGGAKVSENTPSPMPEKNLVPGSEKYLLGLEAAKRVLPSFRTDLIGIEQGAEVQLGQYQTASGAPTVLAISYPTPQMARIRFGAMSSMLGLNQDRGTDSIYGRRQSSYVFLVLGADHSGTATGLMDQFTVAQGVSWDQRYPDKKSFTVQLYQMFVAIFILTTFLIGGAVVAGVLFFLSRRFAKKFFPESQWGRSDDDQLIRLDLKY